jgi:predicted flap endonuclease-1-like 5' DNA nuclease
MWYLLNAYWIPLLLAGLLGVIVGWMSCNNQTIAHNARPSWFSGWVPWGIAAAALAALAAVQMLLPGKQGLLLDTALMLFGAYMLGCCVGCMLRPKPAPHLAHASGSAAKSGTSTAKSGTTGKVANAAVGTAATAAGLAAAKTAANAAGTKSSGTTAAGATSTATSTAGTSSSGGAAAKSASTATETTKASNVTSLSSATGSAESKSSTGSTTGVATGKTTTTNSGSATSALRAAATGVAATAAAVASKSASATSSSDSNLKVFTTAAKFGARPALYNAPRGGKGDELSLIWGVAEKLEHKMNAAGVWHFDQIANWTPEHVEWFEHEFRLDRDKWIEQCKKLAAGWRPDGHVGHRPKG